MRASAKTSSHLNIQAFWRFEKLSGGKIGAVELHVTDLWVDPLVGQAALGV